MRPLFNTVNGRSFAPLLRGAVAQTTSPPASAVAAPVNPAVAVPAVLGKRMACRAASQGLQGQDRQDQIQPCMEQARLDCPRQAIAARNERIS